MSKTEIAAAATGLAMALAWLCATPDPARAQDTPAAEEAAVRAAVEQVFEGMRTADTAMVRAVLAADVRFAVLDASQGPARIGAQTVDGWIRAVGDSERRWDERVYDVEVRLDGAMASVWAPYTFYLGGAVRHCGINSIELLRDAGGWKVTQISDTRRTEGCPDPLGERGP